MSPRLWLCLLLLSGCTSLDSVMSGISNTPDWFTERRSEIRGDKYPVFSEVPDLMKVQNLQNKIINQSEGAKMDRDILFTHPRAVPAPSEAREAIDQAQRDFLAAMGRPEPMREAPLSEAEIDTLLAQVRTLPEAYK